MGDVGMALYLLEECQASAGERTSAISTTSRTDRDGKDIIAHHSDKVFSMVVGGRSPKEWTCSPSASVFATLGLLQVVGILALRYWNTRRSQQGNSFPKLP
jgi:hypothetical protein